MQAWIIFILFKICFIQDDETPAKQELPINESVSSVEQVSEYDLTESHDIWKL